MKIFVMPALYPHKENRQMGIYIYEQCEVIKKHGHELIILDASSRSYRDWDKCNKEYSYEDANGHVYVNLVKGVAQSRLPRLAVATYMKNAERIFKRAIKEQGRPDFIYAHFTFPCGYVAYLLSKKYAIPYVVQEHYSLFLEKKLPKYIRAITRKTIENAVSFYCVSESLKNNISEFTNLKNGIGVIPNLINNRYCYNSSEIKENFTFFSAGNMFKGKCFDLLIESFCNTFSEKENVRLRIAGAGAELENLKNMICEKKREHQIIMLGRLSSDAMLEEYKKCNCFVLLSEKETFGIVYREAMAVGRPVIAAKNGGVEENWQDEYGMLVDKHDLEQASRAMRKMFINYRGYDCRYISERTHELYSQESIYRLLKREFERIREK